MTLPNTPLHEALLYDVCTKGVDNAFLVTAVAPIERVRILLQTQRSNLAVLGSQHTKTPIAMFTGGLFDTTKRVFVEQGAQSFWRGNTMSIVRFAPQQLCYLSLRDAVLSAPHYQRPRSVDNDSGNESGDSSLLAKHYASRFLVGGAAAAVTATVCYPFDYLRTKLASDVAAGATVRSGRARQLFHVTATSPAGPAALFRGLPVTVAGCFVARGGMMCLHAPILERLAPPPPPADVHERVAPTKVVAGVQRPKSKEQQQKERQLKKDALQYWMAWSAIAASAARLAVLPLWYPFDTVRRRMMLDADLAPGARLYVNTRACVEAVFAGEGLRGFYAGFRAEVLRVPVSAILFAWYLSSTRRDFESAGRSMADSI